MDQDKQKIIQAAIALGFVEQIGHNGKTLSCTENQLYLFSVLISQSTLEQIGFKFDE
jgi:hypothetical protein